ncbi:MFS transporter [Nocardiopsis sp. CC223A]|uniref:MFS transporter n=1 Tax=Nocardiopsis sp. CC223A TaxID=3044051 RepID=UPI00278BDDB4|nr:MFS transporter [Nocardiopsis sp. CC223A]
MSSAPRMPAWLTTGVLTLCGMIVALQQTLVIPLLPDLPGILDVSADDASWLVTATLLAGAVATPIVARMADMYGKRRMLLVSLAVMTAGSLIAAVGGSFVPLLIGRAMQGFGASLIPVGISIMRDQLPREKLAGGVALMSATLGIGGALGLPLSGVLYGAFGWTSLFWSTAAVGAVLIALIRLSVAESPQRSPGRFDILGALVLSVVLVGLLLVLSKGAAWGWGGPRVLALTGVSVLFLALWIPLQLKTRAPMVDLRTAVLPPVLLTNIASYFAGFAMFLNGLVLTQELQVPTETGYGLALPVVTAGLLMVPSGLMMLAFSPVAGRMLDRWGGKPTLLIGLALMGLTYLVRVLVPGSLVNAVLGSTLVSVGTAISFAAMPVLIMSAVPRGGTAAANGINALVRSLGTSSASALLALLFASLTVTVDGVPHPSAAGMDAALWAGVAACAAGVAVGLFIPVRGREAEPDPGPVPAPPRDHSVPAPDADGYPRHPRESTGT